MEKQNVKAYKLLKTSWQHQGRIFFEESTLHGVRYIAEAGRPLLEKILWFVCVVVGAIASMVIIVSLWDKFQTNPTITGLDTDFHSWDVPFPAVTLCPMSPSDNETIANYISGMSSNSNTPDDFESFLTNLTRLSYTNIHEFQSYAETGYLADDVQLKEVVFQLMKQCSAVFKECYFKANTYNCCEGFFPIFTENGFCYTFNSRHYERNVPWPTKPPKDVKLEYIKETDIKWSLKFVVNDVPADIFKIHNIAIYVHSSEEIPGLDVKPQHIWDFRADRLLFSVKQTYTTDDARQLTIKQRHCVFNNEIQLKVDNNYTYTACTQECRMDKAKKHCDCVPHFYPEKSDYPYCNLKQLACIATHITDIEEVDSCKCHLGCSNTVYEVEKLNEASDSSTSDSLEAEFVSWPMVRYKREVLFGWVDLLVSFGGIAGLFLGFSLLSGVEVIYYFTIRACCMVYKQPDELIKMRKENAIKSSNGELSAGPYFTKGIKYGHNKSMKKRYNNNVNFPSKLQHIKVQPINTKNQLVVPPFGIEFIN